MTAWLEGVAPGPLKDFSDLAPTIVLSGCNSAINPVTIILVGLGEWDFKDKQTQLELVMMQVGKLFNFAIFALT